MEENGGFGFLITNMEPSRSLSFGAQPKSAPPLPVESLQLSLLQPSEACVPAGAGGHDQDFLGQDRLSEVGDIMYFIEKLAAF